MKNETREKLEKAISSNAEKSESAKSALDAMQHSQAALNLANVIIGLSWDSKQTD